MITVYGPGSGAAAASLLAMAPKSRHLVRQVFAQVGYFVSFFFSFLKYKSVFTFCQLN